MYEYSCTVQRVVDGDTLHLNVDLGCDVSIHMTARLAHVNAPEMNTPQGPVAKAFVEAWIVQHGPKFIVETIKDHKEKYGRYLVVLVELGPDEMTLNNSLIDEGLAVRYEGR
jgi:micrococcal nuclease